MSTWLSFVTSSWAGPVFVVVTVAGLVLSAIAWRKKGARSGIRGVAWSLLPAAAWLTHALGLVGRIVSAIVQFAGSFAFSPKAWLGVILVGISALLFLVSGGIPLVGWRKHHKATHEKAGGNELAASSKPTGSVERARGKTTVKAGAEDDLADVRDILKKHGIS